MHTIGVTHLVRLCRCCHRPHCALSRPLELRHRLAWGHKGPGVAGQQRLPEAMRHGSHAAVMMATCTPSSL